MADFSTSSHRAKWLLTKEQVDNLYLVSNRRAVEELQKYGCTNMETDIDGTVFYPSDQLEVKGKKRPIPEHLSIEEESLIRVYYQNVLYQICNSLQVRNIAKVSAVMYFKRFYLFWSVMEYHPKFLMCTFLYCATKNLDSYIDAKQFPIVCPAISADEVLKWEMLVYKSMDFEILVYGPYRSINPLLVEMKDYIIKEGFEEETVRKKVEEKLDIFMLTDAPLIYPPGQIALAALRSVNNEDFIFDFERYLEKLIHKANKDSHKDLLESLDTLDLLLKSYREPVKSELAKIDRKLTRCREGAGKHKKVKRNKSTNEEAKECEAETNQEAKEVEAKA